VASHSASRPFCTSGASSSARSTCRCASTPEHKRQTSNAAMRRRSFLIAPLVAYTLQAASGEYLSMSLCCILSLSSIYRNCVRSDTQSPLSSQWCNSIQICTVCSCLYCKINDFLMQAAKRMALSPFHLLSLRMGLVPQAKLQKPLSPRQRQQQRHLKSRTSSRA